MRSVTQAESPQHPGVVAAAASTVPYARESTHGTWWLVARALRASCERAGVSHRDIDGLALSSFTLPPDTVASACEYLGLELRWIESVPFGGASGLLALRRAARAVQCGDAGIVACIGADAFGSGAFGQLVANFSGFARTSVYPYAGSSANTFFALITRHYVEKFGATREDFARISVAQRYNANHSPTALFRDKPLSLQDCLDAPPVAEPLHRFDCVMPCAGAEAFLVMSEDRARALKVSAARILSSAELHGAFGTDPVQFRGGWAKFRDGLYEAARLTPKDIDVLQTYDDYPVIVMLQLEDLGFCGKGEAAAFIRSVPMTFDGGGLPHNTSGGQLSAGQAGMAGGYLGLVEALRQLTELKLPNKVPYARTALVSGYGMTIYDRGVCTAAAILEGDAD